MPDSEPCHLLSTSNSNLSMNTRALQAPVQRSGKSPPLPFAWRCSEVARNVTPNTTESTQVQT